MSLVNDVQEQQSPAQQFLLSLMKVNFDVCQLWFSFDIEIGQRFQDVTDIGSPRNQNSERLFARGLVSEEVDSGRESPVLNVADLIDDLHSN